MVKRTKIKLVVFDMDGTLTRPYLDFAAIRNAIGLKDQNVMILDYIENLTPKAREQANMILAKFEDEAAENVEFQDGAAYLLADLKKRGVKTAIFTRNSLKSVNTVLGKLGLSVDHIITRDHAPSKPLKPAPEAIIQLLDHYGLSAQEAMMVGDYSPDIIAGRAAGVRTVLLDNNDGRQITATPDHYISKLKELLELL